MIPPCLNILGVEHRVSQHRAGMVGRVVLFGCKNLLVKQDSNFSEKRNLGEDYNGKTGERTTNWLFGVLDVSITLNTNFSEY